jgi:hypothetical protein
VATPSSVLGITNASFPIEASPNIGTGAHKWLILNAEKKFRMIMAVVIAIVSLTTSGWPFISYWQESPGSPDATYISGSGTSALVDDTVIAEAELRSGHVGRGNRVGAKKVTHATKTDKGRW